MNQGLELISTIPSPTLLVKLPKQVDMVPLPIVECEVSVQIIRNFARTKLFLKFFNKTDQILEGQFVFPLLQGKVLSGYALEIDGKFREAVVVEKAKGRQVFESIIRQKIDPGLLELTKGNAFQTRIYPIPPKGHKSIIIHLEEELSLKENGWAFQMPFHFKEPMEKFSLDINIEALSQKPIPYKNELNLEFEKSEHSFKAKFQANEFQANKQLGFLIPNVEKNVSPLIQEKKDDLSYFYLNLTPNLVRRPKKLPSKITLLWDASSSAKKRDLEGELSLLREYLQKIGNLEVKVVIFSFWVHSSKDFLLQNSDTEEILSYLRNIQYDGGTQLGVLDLNQYDSDEFLLFSDGVSNFGESEINLSSVPIYSINSQAIAEHSYLEYISKKTGGAYLNLTKLAFLDSLNILTHSMYSFLSCKSNDSIIELYPSLPTIISKEISFVGLMKGEETKLELNFGFGKEIIHTEQIEIKKSTSILIDSNLDKIFAVKKITELDLQYKKNKAEITALGKEFSIVTRNTSLIVLDRLEDYISHQIVPPKELQKAYFEALKFNEKYKDEEKRRHLDEIARKFQEQIDWWNTNFSPKEKSFKKKSDRQDDPFAPPPAPSMDASPLAGDFDESSAESEESISLSEDALDDIIQDDEDTESKPASEDSSAVGSITLQKWSPDEDYLKRLQSASEKERYSIYLQEKESNSNRSSFYLDVADFFMENGQVEIALRVLSNLAELNLENHQLLRILGYRLLQLRQWKFAIKIFEDVLEIREEEPQSYRDLALAYMADSQFQKALDFFYNVISNPWDDRFPGIQLIVIHEMNAMLATCKQELKLEGIDKRFLKNLPVDLRVILTWDADNTDLDLWVTDPRGEKCYYALPLTEIGGKMSQDFRAGYGPEEFLLKKAIPGKYLVEVNFFGTSQQILTDTTTLQVTLTTNFGRENQKDQSITLRLKNVKEMIRVGEFEMK